MRNLFLIVGVLGSFIGFANPPTVGPFGPRAFSSSKVVYGDESRIDSTQTNITAWLDQSRGVGLLMRAGGMTQEGTRYRIAATPFTHYRGYPLCTDEPFVGEPRASAGLCTAFLIAPNLIATAGHCTPLKPTHIVFDFERGSPSGDPTLVDASSVYQISRLLGASRAPHDDHAVYELTRPVEGRQPLEVDLSGTIAAGTKVHVIGHPVLLPKKTAGEAEVLSEKATTFLANIDTYGGNSGGPIFDSNSGKVVGIMRAGAQDFRLDQARGCVRSYNCAYEGPFAQNSDQQCVGEMGVKASILAQFIAQSINVPGASRSDSGEWVESGAPAETTESGASLVAPTPAGETVPNSQN